MNVLVVGGNGFTGKWLIKELQKNPQYMVDSIDIHETSAVSLSGNYYQLDLLSSERIAEVMEESRPKHIYFLVGTYSASRLQDYIDINLKTLVNLLETIRSRRLHTKLLCVSSAAVYGPRLLSELPITEDEDLRPTSDYGLSKVLMEELLVSFAGTYPNLQYILVRPSNLIGPGLPDNLLMGKLVKEAISYKYDNQEYIILFNLNGKRDYIDIRDAVRLYVDVMETELSEQILNISTGNLIEVSEVIDELSHIHGIDLPVKTSMEPLDEIYSGHSQDPAKVKQLLKLEKILKYDLRQSLIDMTELVEQDQKST